MQVHGEVAQALAAGAVPATIAVVDGEPRIGLDDAALGAGCAAAAAAVGRPG
jgi:pseudouridine-5'-phosphate glycosidase